MNTFINNEEFNKKKVIFIMRATQMGKFREIAPDSNLTAEDFWLHVVVHVEKILKAQRVPIIVGGSNFCFIWIEVEQSVLNRRFDMRVDQMVNT
uniref:Uncharacterized protein n=1 Tax=Solanum lycopersicum TaxID=4081 RepID=A0A3Q7IUI6_SOLLC